MVEFAYKSLERGRPGTIGWRVHYFEEVGSTQDVAARLAAAGAEDGTAVIAEFQSGGRGRMGRRWHSPSGVNLYVTVILRPRIPLSEVPCLSLVAGVAAAEALETVAPGIVALKWPNDVWLNRKKAGGIIAEAVSDADQGLGFVILGIGLNLNLALEQLPSDLRDRATSVRIETGKLCDRAAVAANLFSRLDSRYVEARRLGFAAISPAWERYSALTGKRVTVVSGDARDAGVVKGIDSDGALLLEAGSQIKRIVAGDVSIEGAYG